MNLLTSIDFIFNRWSLILAVHALLYKSIICSSLRSGCLWACTWILSIFSNKKLNFPTTWYFDWLSLWGSSFSCQPLLSPWLTSNAQAQETNLQSFQIFEIWWLASIWPFLVLYLTWNEIFIYLNYVLKIFSIKIEIPIKFISIKIQLIYINFKRRWWSNTRTFKINL